MSSSTVQDVPPAVDVRRAGTRFRTHEDWLDSWHSFSFGPHRDPRNVGHGLLVVHNDDRVRAGRGFGAHPHRDMEIVTWVLEGELEHRDSLGSVGRIAPGLAQRMSAGTGIVHSEANPSATADVHLVQMWVLPDTRGLEPSYEQRSVDDALAGGGLVPVASGRRHEGAVAIHQRDATLWVGRLGPGATVVTPDAPHVHLFVATGDAHLGDATGRASGDAATTHLDAGDAVRLTAAGALTVEAGPAGAEVIVWETA